MRIVRGPLLLLAVLAGAGGPPGASAALPQDPPRGLNPEKDAQLGQHLLSVGDLDGDGCGDLAAVLPRKSGRGRRKPKVQVLSGSSWNVLWEAEGEVGSGFGEAMAGPGDLDGDRVPDVVVGAGGGAGTVTAYSGRSGKSLWSVNGDRLSGLGETLAATRGPVKGGIRGILAGGRRRRGSDGSGGTVGWVRLLSGTDGSTLWTRVGETDGQLFGKGIASVGDFDGDGGEDVAVSGPWSARDRRDGSERLAILSVATGRPLAELSFPKGTWSGGWELYGDPAADPRSGGTLVASVEVVEGKDPGISGLVLYSGADLLQSKVLSSPTGFDAMGTSLVRSGDLDGDGTRDFVVGAPGALTKEGAERGAVRAYSGKDLRLIWERPGAVDGGRFGCGLALLDAPSDKGGPRFVVGSPAASAGGLERAGLLTILSTSGKVLGEVGGIR